MKYGATGHSCTGLYHESWPERMLTLASSLRLRCKKRPIHWHIRALHESRCENSQKNTKRLNIEFPTGNHLRNPRAFKTYEWIDGERRAYFVIPSDLGLPANATHHNEQSNLKNAYLPPSP